MSIVKDEHKTTLRKWHAMLQEKRGLRASLRRSVTINESCVNDGFHSLLMETHTLWKVQFQEWRFTALAMTAALAAHVRLIDERQSFATQLGYSSTAAMSELRFKRLLAVKTPDELLRQLRRAIRLLNGSVNLISLAEDIFVWCREQDELMRHIRQQQRPTEFIRIRWALEYYQADDVDEQENTVQG
ncbi:type I-E CRISPR-associated protein Cse2/CasB [Citrobacter farmeri]|uniref:type I-E CRISPR-associated protein Cse2/CasB n=1 Tax=Citrobacter farmeri TaxID=67824 RepID=UPI0018AB940B|nr:type I-E CRISPR-associated protein Cse2/CasB [Citrobacter farmeri]MDB2182879.1 type I-E CRISPR-associated protein Cse2/CasB [Citrobacter farmeri]GJL44642.1 type I-E CRISPR-associated protein Cse2/CasB [Citrobacter farmeri]HEM7969178.1 type I-E CRISPR-associated protein Cse2/CasB [Citrobacter farmeri]HEM7986818.1 type I-E CRISPR-associated protein Cse2/CasB [Citrobacter farmeri]